MDPPNEQTRTSGAFVVGTDDDRWSIDVPGTIAYPPFNDPLIIPGDTIIHTACFETYFFCNEAFVGMIEWGYILNLPVVAGPGGLDQINWPFASVVAKETKFVPPGVADEDRLAEAKKELQFK